MPIDPPRRRARRSGAADMAMALGVGALAAGLVAYQARRRGAARRPPDSAPGRVARRRWFGAYAVAGRTVTIARPRDEVYAFWRDFSNLPRVMENITSVTATGPHSHRWTVRGPGEGKIDIDTRIVDDRDGEQIAWRSVAGAEIDTEGKVTFRDAPGGRGTEVAAVISYAPPAGELGRWVAKLFQREPALQARRELKRLKMLLETGEIATSQMVRSA